MTKRELIILAVAALATIAFAAFPDLRAAVCR